MKPRGHRFPTPKLIAVCFCALCAYTPLAVAQIVTNGDFSANAGAFIEWPGYLSSVAVSANPASITGWGGGFGINGTSTSLPNSPFGPTTPAEHYAFLQYNSGLDQTITTSVNQNYLFSFEAAARAGQISGVNVIAGGAGVVLNGDVAGSWWLDNTAFRRYAFAFNSSSSSAYLRFDSVGSGDHTTNIDKVSVTPISSAITVPADTTFFTETSGTVSHAFQLTGSAQTFFQRPGTPTYTGNISTDGSGGAFSIQAAGLDSGAGSAQLTFRGNTIALGNKTLSIVGSIGGNNWSVAQANARMTTFDGVNFSSSDNVVVTNGALNITGNSAVNIGGQLASGFAWNSAIIQGSSVVTIANGIAFNKVGSNLALNGGTLITPSIWGNNFYQGSSTIFNGTRVVASQNNASFLKVAIDWDEASTNGTAHIGNGGAIFDTQGYTITIAPPLADLPGNAGTLKKLGTGSLVLSGANTYSGGTTIEGGFIQVTGGTNGGNLGTGPVTLNGGGVKNNDSTPSIDTLTTLGTLGGYVTAGWSKYFILVGQVTGPGALNINTDSGTVLLYNSANNYSGNTNIGTTGPGHFNQVSTAKLELSNSNVLPDGTTVNLLTAASILAVNGKTETIGGLTGTGSVTLGLAGQPGALTVGAGNISSTFGGTISGNGNLTKTGTGTLTLTASNSHSGTTSFSGGVLRLDHATAIPGGIGASGGTSALTLNGGVVGLGAGNFNRGLGTGVAQVQFTGSGGFAAYGADRSVNLGGSSAGVTWGSANFVPDGSLLVLSASDATHRVEFQNPINLAGAVRTVQVNNGAATTDALLSGALSGTGASGLTKTGGGTLTLTGTNDYKGATTVSNGTLVINGNQAGATGALTVENGARLAGSGTIGGATTVKAGATHAPGNSPGIQTFAGDLTYDSTSLFEWDLASSAVGTRGTGYDGVNVGGTLGGSDAIFKIVLNSGSFTDGFWDGNQQWTDIFKNGETLLSMAGIFSSFQYWEGATNVTSSVGTQGYFTISSSTLNWTAVPEPTGAVAGLLLGAGLLRRRRKVATR